MPEPGYRQWIVDRIKHLRSVFAVDWGGREVIHNRRGYIPANAPPILARLRMDVAPVLNCLSRDDLPSFGALGPVTKLRVFAKSVGRKFIKGHVIGNRLCPERAK
jgi:hypothetical protein